MFPTQCTGGIVTYCMSILTACPRQCTLCPAEPTLCVDTPTVCDPAGTTLCPVAAAVTICGEISITTCAQVPTSCVLCPAN
jgi:hypothetical protein